MMTKKEKHNRGEGYGNKLMDFQAGVQEADSRERLRKCYRERGGTKESRTMRRWKEYREAT